VPTRIGEGERVAVSIGIAVETLVAARIGTDDIAGQEAGGERVEVASTEVGEPGGCVLLLACPTEDPDNPGGGAEVAPGVSVGVVVSLVALSVSDPLT